MSSVEYVTSGYEVTSEEFAEDVLTSPDLPPYADAARNQLLKDYYSGTISDHSIYDIVSLVASQFRDEIKTIQDKFYDNDFDENREFAHKLYQATKTVASYLGLNLDEAQDRQKHLTTYGRSRIDGMANLLVGLGSGIYDQVSV